MKIQARQKFLAYLSSAIRWDIVKTEKFVLGNGGELDGTGRGLVMNARDGKFPTFGGKKLGTQKKETGNADL